MIEHPSSTACNTDRSTLPYAQHRTNKLLITMHYLSCLLYWNHKCKAQTDVQFQPWSQWCTKYVPTCIIITTNYVWQATCTLEWMTCLLCQCYSAAKWHSGENIHLSSFVGTWVRLQPKCNVRFIPNVNIYATTTTTTTKRNTCMDINKTATTPETTKQEDFRLQRVHGRFTRIHRQIGGMPSHAQQWAIFNNFHKSP